MKEGISDVLEQEVLSVYMISVKLNHMVVWVRLSFLLLIVAISLLALIYQLHYRLRHPRASTKMINDSAGDDEVTSWILSISPS